MAEITEQLEWKASIIPNTKKDKNWVYFDNGSRVIRRTGSTTENIVVVSNEVAEEMAAEVVLCQYDENGNPRIDDTKHFYITQDKTCVDQITIPSADYVLNTCATKFVKGENEFSSIEVSGVTISANKFSSNCSASSRTITQAIDSTMGCDGRHVTVTVTQEENTTAYTSNNVTATTMTKITFPYGGGRKNVTATASRKIGYTKCSCPTTTVTTPVTFTWSVPESTSPTGQNIETAFTETVNGQVTEFRFTAVQEGPECGGWLELYKYNCIDLPTARRLLSVYDNGLCIYAASMLCPTQIPSWLSGDTTFEFPYYQGFQEDDCSSGYVASDEDGVLSGEITPSSDDYYISGIVKTNDYDSVFEFELGRKPVDYKDVYFTIRALSSTCKITFTAKNDFTLQYSTTFGNSWNNYSGQFSITKGFTALFKASVNNLENTNGLGSFKVEGNFNVEGNILSLLYDDTFSTVTNINNHQYAFKELLLNQTGLIYAKDLILQATTLSDGCYMGLFKGCSNLMEGPASLAAEDLPTMCYHLMYQGTKKMKVLPAFNGKNFGDTSCKQMFEGCGVETIPDNYMDNATGTVGREAVWSMFNGCKDLVKTMKTLPLPTTNYKSNAYMFQGCSKLEEGPVLMASKLGDYAYQGMFKDCTNLKKITTFTTGTISPYTYEPFGVNSNSWTQNITTSGVLYKKEDSHITDYKIPSTWITQNIQ